MGARELGINFFDTAETYGNSEHLLGEFMSEAGKGEFVIATKVAPHNASHGSTLRSANKSMERLRVDCIDLLQLHWPNPLVPLNETMRAFDELHLDGKVRAAGLSNFGVKGLIEAKSALKHAELVSDQVQYNLLDRDPEKELLPYIEREGLILIAYSPLAQGLLTDKFGAKPSDIIRALNPYFASYNLNRIRPLIDVLKQIAHERDVSTAQVSLNWLLSKKAVVPIVGVKNEQQLTDVAQAFTWGLNDYELRLIDEALKELKVSRAIGYLTTPCRIFRSLAAGG